MYRFLANCDDAIKIVSSFNNNDIIFWYGAGISVQKPTLLPLGNSLTEYYFKQILEDEYFEFIEKYNEFRRIFKEYGDSGYPRLESLFQIFRELNQNGISNYDKSIKFFSDTDPNINHYMLSSLFDSGSILITSNFDDCVEKAFRSMTGNELIWDKENQAFVLTKTEKKIFHYHGIPDDLESIGISLDTVSSLNKNFGEVLSNYLAKKMLFVFVGYSLSDDLDINPFFEKIALKKSSVLFVNHKIGDNEVRLDSARLSYLKNTFGEVYEICIDTSLFLEKICAMNANNDLSIKSSSINYIDRLDIKMKNIVIDKDVFKIFLSVQFGIRLKNIISNFNIQNDHIKKRVSQYFSDFYIEYKDMDLQEAKYYLDKLSNEERKEDDWMIINRVSCVFYKKNAIVKLSLEDYTMIENLILIIEEYIKSDHSSYWTHFTIYRNLGVLNCILRNYENGFITIKKIINKFIRVSNYDGALASLIDLYYCYLMKYNSDEDNDSIIGEMKKAESTIDQALSLGVNKRNIAWYDYYRRNMLKR